MKQICTLLFTLLGVLSANAQAVLNEVYAIPGMARQEFFEFYNNSNSSTSMDNYTMVTYFEEGSKKGFYVLDIPNLTVGPMGYFVGSSSMPFNYQGVSNSTSTNFSWNDLAFLASNNGYLRKWVIGTNVSAAIDGNANYDLDVVPPNFNDFFGKIGGTGATYNVFVYNNGILQSTFLGGTGGNTFLPTYILSLPSLNVDMTATSPDFTINFSTYSNVNPEYVTQDVGSDNGYIRIRDGFCGMWSKSDNGTSHTPQATNGGALVEPDGEISVSAMIVPGTASGGSTLNYDVVAGPSSEFPVTMNVYIDNGTVFGQLDVNDTYLVSKTETVVTDGGFSTVYLPYDENILIQTTTSAGCIDNIVFIPNVGVLPVRLISFAGSRSENSNLLKWIVAENESGKQIQIERSNDGTNFTTIKTIINTDKTGTENYTYSDGTAASVYYRIKLISTTGKETVSQVIYLGSQPTTNTALRLSINPVDSYLSFSYSSNSNAPAIINIYNLSGVKVYSQKVNINKGANTITIPADGRLYRGTYILELANDTDNNRVKFIKR